MSSWKDLYSEVKKRKMEALNKKDVVEAVEKHGRILAVEGRYEKPKKVVDHMYAAKNETIKPGDIMKKNLSDYDVVLIGCPGDQIPSSALPKINEYVTSDGGWLVTTDWAIKHIVEVIFPGYIRWNGAKTADAVVGCQILEPNHPFLEGVVSEIQQDKWQKGGPKDAKKAEFKWWLETRSFPIQVLNPEVKVLIVSWEIKQKWGEAPVLCYFDYGKMGGRVIHLISHTHLQKGGVKGKYASALILTNILDEKVSQKMGISKKPTSGYVSNWEQEQLPQQPQWVNPSQNNQYIMPSDSNLGLTGTAQIIEINMNDGQFSFANKCGYCNYDFGDYTGKIYKCKACGTQYHESCLNMQINEGTCKKCGKILLW
ncbi:MAG: PHD finger domain-containing protein [Candidatus Hermodarchaeota archaeon]